MTKRSSSGRSGTWRCRHIHAFFPLPLLFFISIAEKTYAFGNKLSIHISAWRKTRRPEWYGRIQSHGLVDHGVEIRQTAHGVGGDVRVLSESLADLGFEPAVDRGVLHEEICDCREGGSGRFAAGDAAWVRVRQSQDAEERRRG